MQHNQLTHHFLEQSKDLIWIVDLDYKLVYANKTYFNFMKNDVGTEKKLNDTAFVEEFGAEDVERWKSYYNRVIAGEYFEIEEHYNYKKPNEIQYYQINFEPLRGDDNNIIAISCQSKYITDVVKKRTEGNRLMNASLDVFCSINEEGNFVQVSEASFKLWGYRPEELIGKAYQDYILESDLPKTTVISAAILSGEEIKSFVNRYKKKDGGVAYNLWSATWDNAAKMMYCVARDAQEKIEQEEKIALSEQRFKALVQEGSDMISIIDSEGKYIYTSPTTTAILGITPEEFQGKTIFDFIHPDDAERCLVYMQKIATEKKVNVQPFRLKDSKQNWRWIETVLTNMMDNPVINGFVANSRDVTESVNARIQVEKKEQFNATLLESSPDCYKVLDVEGRIQYMNYNGLCLMELDDFAAIKNKEWWSFWGSDNEKLVRSSVEKALKGTPVNFTAFCPTAKGKPKWWDVLVTPVGKLGEEINQIISVSRDVTLQKQEEQRLKLFESIITNTNDAVLITEAEPFDEPGPRILYVNEAFTKMTGYSADEVIGKSPRILQGPNSNKEELKKLGQALRKWESYEITTINYKKNGEEFWINFTVTPVADEKGWYTHWIAIERDVTEQKNKELENALLAKISLNFNSKNDFINSSNELCKSISQFGNFDWVELWTANREKKHINLISHYVMSSADEEFYQDGLIETFKLSESLAGAVWNQKKQIIWDDVSTHKNFVRKNAAKKIGLKAVLGIPLIFNNELVGVLKIGTKHNATYLKNYQPIFKILEQFVGSELNRKKLEYDLSHLFDVIPDILCLINFRGRFLKINKSGCDLIGFTEDEILFHKFEDFVHPLDKGIFTNELMGLNNDKNIIEFETRLIKKNGEVIWLNCYCNAVSNEGIIYATAKNITEEKKLKELNRITRTLAKIGSWEVDLVNQSLYWTDEVHQMHETDSKTFIPNLAEAINFYREDFRQLVNDSIGKSVTTGESFDFEAVLITATKKEVWVRAIGNPEFVNGTCTRIYGSFQDINNQKESEIRLISLADNLPGVVYQYIINPDGTDRLKYVTKASATVWGFEAHNVIENNQLIWDQIKAGGQLEQVTKSIAESIEFKTKWNARWKYVMPSGEIRTHLGYGSPNFLTDGTVLFNSVILDITNEAKNEELLEQVTKLAKIGSWEINLQKNQTYWSPIVHDIMETDAMHFVPNRETNINFFREDYHPIVKSQLENCAEKGTPVDFEAIVITAHKNKKWVRVLGKLELVDGKPVRLFGSVQDITERKTAETLLIESENKFRSLIENSDDMLSLINDAGRIIYVSPSVERKVGYTNEECKTLEINDIMHPDDLSMAMETLETVFKNPAVPIPSIIRNRKKDGTYIWVEGTLTNMLHLPGVNAIVANVRDITEKKKVEEENKFKANLLSTVGQAAIATDLDGIVNYWNKAAETIYGWTEEEALGKNIMNLTTPEASKIQALEIMENLQQGQTWEGKFKVRKKDGTLFLAHMSNSPIFNEHKKLSGIIGISNDITHIAKTEDLLKQYTLELERSNEELEQFAFVASHDLQEPLRMISSFMELLQRKYGEQLDEKGHQYIHFATDGAKRMKQIILDLLDYSRANKHIEGKEDINLNEVISEFKQLRRKIISEKTVTITSKDLPTLNTHKAAITQILNCILDNALKYSVKGIPPIIEINAIEHEKEWEFSIKDNGIGIDSQFYDKIFIIFQRLHNKDEYAGTGIGLSIAKRHIEFLGGRIWLESVLGKGSVFYFTISKVK